MKKKIYFIGLVICFFVFAFSCCQVYRDYADNKEHTEEFKELADSVEQPQDSVPAPEVPFSDESSVLPNYAELYQKNPDMAGWVSIEGTTINYPVMHTPDNPDFYLKHNFDKEYSVYGVPYIAEDCSVEEASDNIVIYGHHIKGGKMFGALTDYKDKTFYEKHKTIHFDTVTEQAEYEIISVFKTTAYDDAGFKFYYFINAETKEDFLEYVKSCKSLALYETGVTAEYGDKLITLSTCEYSQKNGRFVVVAKKI